MAGAYCQFCDRRCFVYRQVRVGGEVIWSGHMATCAEGKAHDRAQIGQDADTAHNPAMLREHDVFFCEESDCEDCLRETCRECAAVLAGDPSTIVGDDTCGTCRDRLEPA